MNTELQTFAFHSHPFTVITDELGASWFVAKEVSEILEYSDAFEMTKKLDEDEVQNLQIAGFGNRGVNVINESGLWSSVLRSTKPEAKAVKKWLTSEVLPAIHKTGNYGLANPAHQLVQLQARLYSAQERIIELMTEKLTRLETSVPRKHRPDEIAAALRCRLEGFSYRDIAQLLGRSKDSVNHMVRKAEGRSL